MIDCIRDATVFVYLWTGSRGNRDDERVEAVNRKKRYVEMTAEEMKPVVYTPRDTSKKKKTSQAQASPDTATRAMP